jgi:hemolysin D
MSNHNGAFAIARAAWREERAQPKVPARAADELEFLPAAIEVMETPASPAGRAVAWTIMAFFTIAVVWASVGTIDVVAVAQGKIVPTGRSKVVQPMETSVVKAIRVEDGQAVKAGEVLIELDPTAATADRQRLTADLMNAKVEAARLQAALAEDPLGAFITPANADESVVRTNRALLLSQVEENRSKLASLDQEIARKQADRASIDANVVRLEKTIPLAREQARARMELAERGHFPRLQALDSKQKVIEQEQSLSATRHSRDENSAAIASLERQRGQTQAEFEKNVLGQEADAERRIAATTQELLKAEQRQELQTITAPIDGVVQQLAVHTVGGVVTPAQQLMVLVPGDGALEVEANILNRDIGFIEPGQDAKVKLETFLFTKYGTINGHVTSVSRDAVPEGMANQQVGAPPPAANGTTGAALVYPARISLDRTVIDIDGRQSTLGAGMAVTVEIKTESRRLIEYLLSPIMRYRHTAMHER